MGDSELRRVLLDQGPVDVSLRPELAWARVWTQGWRFHGRASRSEYWWVLALEAPVALGVWWLLQRAGLASHWTLSADPFGIVPVPQVTFRLFTGRGSWWGIGAGRDVTPTGWDLAVLAGLALTFVPRWSLLVRRLHDRDHSGLWVFFMVVFGPLGAIVVAVMVLRSARPRGARFDRGLFAGRREPVAPPGPRRGDGSDSGRQQMSS
ncbi:DUF805 domain-containing protein [Curtobacterium caseinilyticum]|uniref:DUF805 domain-containing protein n=1 Tax=Curtobacterium caseinilyticum TaxID=3055137 RepID=A0ABT7TU41_9MICO|nr:DUF805 domain-containing protein [Curtobacterium caseinilyticum]MDM7893105.1 DUF805 domain-containing protein [Curtobacterium caseinilyticum]